jgi:ParB-like chromosome segregation protein Spo0J
MGKPDAGLDRRPISIDQIIPNPRNPRRHPQDQIDRLMASLRRFGQTKPVMGRAANTMLIAGHGVWEAAKRAGLSELDCLVWQVDQKTADAYMLADNRHGDLSQPDGDRVAELLREIDAFDYMSVGFSDDEVDSLLNDLDADTLQVDEVDTSKVDDRAWVSIRCPLRVQAQMLDRLKAVMADVPDVEVELGTVASS